MARQSKPYFDEEPVPGVIRREKGVYFIGYLNNPENILKMVNNQYGKDSLTRFFNTLCEQRSNDLSK